MSTLNLETLGKLGALDKSDLVKKTITFTTPKGEEVSGDVWVKTGLSYATVVAELQPEITKEDKIAIRIANRISDENGEFLYTSEQVKDFDGNLIFELLVAIGEVEQGKQKASEKQKKV